MAQFRPAREAWKHWKKVIYKSYDRGELKTDSLQTNILIHTAAGGVSKVANFNSLLDSPAYEFYLFDNQVCHIDSFLSNTLFYRCCYVCDPPLWLRERVDTVAFWLSMVRSKFSSCTD